MKFCEAERSAASSKAATSFVVSVDLTVESSVVPWCQQLNDRLSVIITGPVSALFVLEAPH